MSNDKRTVFYSWQSDSPADVNRQFIEDALTEALQRMKADAQLEPALRSQPLELDKDTQGVPGSPPITQTILDKIDRCSTFVSDLTFVGQSFKKQTTTSRRRLLPNPNVLLEYGYAVRAQGHDRMIAVMNTAYGEPRNENLPFDVRHLRWPIVYPLSRRSLRLRT